jgi:hypothetical protein
VSQARPRSGLRGNRRGTPVAPSGVLTWWKYSAVIVEVQQISHDVPGMRESKDAELRCVGAADAIGETTFAVTPADDIFYVASSTRHRDGCRSARRIAFATARAPCAIRNNEYVRLCGLIPTISRHTLGHEFVSSGPRRPVTIHQPPSSKKIHRAMDRVEGLPHLAGTPPWPSHRVHISERI